MSWDRWDHGCPDLPDEQPSDEMLEDEAVAAGYRDPLTGKLLASEAPHAREAVSRFGDYIGRDFAERPPADPWSIVARLVLVALLAGCAWVLWVATVALVAYVSRWTAAGVYLAALVWAWRSDWVGVVVRW